MVKDEAPEQADKTELQAKYDELKGKANDGYTEDSWSAFQKALDDAKAVLDNKDAKQSEVDSALDALVKADEGLVKAEDPDQGGNGGNQGGNGGNTGNGGQGNQGGNAGGSNGGSGLPQTGDPAVMAVAGTGIIGSVTAALGAFFHRRRRDQ